MATAPAPRRHRPRGNSITLHGIDWRTYSCLLRAFENRSGVRLTYDRGSLQIMTPLLEHESPAALLARFVIVLTEELGLGVRSGASVTLRRRKRKRGLEPDGCWWIAGEPLMRGKRHLDLRTDPPPDLAVECDVTSSSLNRMGIYAAVGVPEVWRYDGTDLTFQLLQPDGTYAAHPTSRAFPFLTPADLTAFLALAASTEENALVRQFRDRVRQQVASGAWKAPP
jgi:Uma2 family endonuclease